MALEDYTKAHQPDNPPRTQKLQTHILGLMIMSGLVGFGGGLLAIRVSPEIVSSTESITQRVVTENGELIADIVDQVADSVVSINVTSLEESFNPFFGSSSRESQSAGTGIILTSDGLVVTNDHVIPDNVTEVSLVFNDGSVYDSVEVIGREPFNDIAYLQIKDVSGLKPASLGDSDKVRVGQQVVAIGNALGEFDTTVTSGIISGQGRPILAGTGADTELLVNLFQTDASINPGNSGGPLLDMNGDIIAINTAVAGNAENIGFAIPINDVKPGIVSVEKHGELIRPYMGVRYITLNKEVADDLDVETEVGALIYDEQPSQATIAGSPADKAGLENGDVIKEVNGIALSEEKPLPNVVGRFQVGETVTLKVLRGGEELSIDVTLEQAPANL